MAMSRGVILILLALLALLSGCKSLPSRSVERITRDTVYIHNQRLDSVYVYQDRLIDRTQDTLQVKETRVSIATGCSETRSIISIETASLMR